MKLKIGEYYTVIPKAGIHNKPYDFLLLEVEGDTIVYKWTRNNSTPVKYTDSLEYRLKYNTIVPNKIMNSKLYKVLL